MKLTISYDGLISKVPSLAEAVQGAAFWLDVHRVYEACT